MEEVNCPICDIDKTEFFYDKERENNPVTFVICKSCGLVYQNPRKTQTEFDEYYQNSFREIRTGNDLTEYIESRVSVGEDILKIISSFLFKKKRNVIKRILFKNKIFSVLDIGCGVGGVLLPFIREGYSCEGIDAPSYYTKIGKEKLGVKIEEVFISEYKTKKKYDVIILNHVLEHFLHPLEELKRIRELLRDDGLLYIEVPDIERPYSWTSLPYFFMLGHVYYYSPVTLEILLNKAGFKRIYLDNISSPFMKNVFVKKNNYRFSVIEDYYLKLRELFNEVKREKAKSDI